MEKLQMFILLYILIAVFSFFYVDAFVEEDGYAFYWINSMSNDIADAFFSIITHLGSAYLWLGIGLVFWIKKKHKTASYILAGTIIGGVTTLILKYIIMRMECFWE